MISNTKIIVDMLIFKGKANSEENVLANSSSRRKVLQGEPHHEDAEDLALVLAAEAHARNATKV